MYSIFSENQAENGEDYLYDDGDILGNIRVKNKGVFC